MHDKRCMQVHVNSVWAADLFGRKSTTVVIVRRGEHLLRHMSCLQTLVTLSSADAENYASVRGACKSFEIQSHYQDWMIDVPIQIYNNGSGARSVPRKRGVVELLSSWSLEIGCRCRRAESSRYTRETTARSQDS